MKLPSGDGNIIRKWVAVDGDKRKRNDESDVNVGIPLAEISLCSCEDFNHFIYEIQESKYHEKKPRNLGQRSFIRM